MPSPFSRFTDEERRRITLEIRGAITAEALRSFIDSYPPQATISATPDFDRLVDMTGLEGELTLPLVRTIADGLRAARDGFTARYAIVSPSDEAYGMMQTLVRLAFEDTERARVFRSREGAEAWLSLPPRSP